MKSSSKIKVKVYLSAPTPKTVEIKERLEIVRRVIKELGYTFTYDWMADKEKNSPEKVFSKATLGIKTADLVIAEVTFPSTAVGQQIATATSNRIPVVALHLLKDGKASRFTLGSKSEFLMVVGYDDVHLTESLNEAVDKIVKGHYVKFNFISTKELNAKLDLESKKLGISRSQLLRKIVSDWLPQKDGS